MIDTTVFNIILFMISWKHAIVAILILYIGLIGVFASLDI